MQSSPQCGGADSRKLEASRRRRRRRPQIFFFGAGAAASSKYESVYFFDAFSVVSRSRHCFYVSKSLAAGRKRGRRERMAQAATGIAIWEMFFCPVMQHVIGEMKVQVATLLSCQSLLLLRLQMEKESEQHFPFQDQRPLRGAVSESGRSPHRQTSRISSSQSVIGKRRQNPADRKGIYERLGVNVGRTNG